MGGIAFDKKITLGNVLTIIVMVFGGFGFLLANESRLKSVEMEVAEVKRDVIAAATLAQTTESRTISQIATANTAMNEIKVSMRGVQTSIEFLVEAERRRGR
jgi:hypothetical protein